MSRTNDVYSEIWGTGDFLDLSPHAKLVYFWSFTNAECGMAGVYHADPRMVALATGLNDQEVAVALAELETARFVLYARGVLFVRSRVKRLRTKTTNIAKSIATTVGRLDPAHPVRRAFLQEYSEFHDWTGDALVGELKALQVEPPMEPPTEPPLEVPGRGGAKAQASVVEGSTDDGHARDARPPTGVHPQIAEVMNLIDGADVILLVDEGAISTALQRAAHLGRDVIDVTLRAISNAQAHRGDLHIKSWSGQINAVLDRADLGGLRAASDAARAGASRPSGKESPEDKVARLRAQAAEEARREAEAEARGEAA